MLHQHCCRYPMQVPVPVVFSRSDPPQVFRAVVRGHAVYVVCLVSRGRRGPVKCHANQPSHRGLQLPTLTEGDGNAFTVANPTSLHDEKLLAGPPQHFPPTGCRVGCAKEGVLRDEREPTAHGPSPGKASGLHFANLPSPVSSSTEETPTSLPAHTTTKQNNPPPTPKTTPAPSPTGAAAPTPPSRPPSPSLPTFQAGKSRPSTTSWHPPLLPSHTTHY